MQINGMDPLWVPVSEALRLVGVGHSRFYEWIADGTVKSVKIGRKRLISFESLKRLGERQEAA